MGQPTVKVQGARELRAALKRAGISLADLKAANQAVGALVARAATPHAPRRTGRLGGSARAAKAAGRARVMAGGASVPYAGPIHWGWPARHIAPQPWIADAARDTQGAWMSEYQDAIDQIVQTVHRSTP